MNNIKKDYLVGMIRDYAAEKGYKLNYDYDRYDDYTTFYVDGNSHTIVWKHFDNIYKAFNRFVESVEKPMKPEYHRSENTVNHTKKEALYEMLFDYCKSNKLDYHGCFDAPSGATEYYIGEPGDYYTVKWDECDNIYDAFMTIINNINRYKAPRSFYISTARSGGKSMLQKIFDYYCNDIDITRDVWTRMNPHLGSIKIKDVIFNDPATIVFWTDGTKTVVKAQDGEPYDPEKGFAMAVTKKHFGNEGNYFTEVRKWIDIYEEKLKKQQKEKAEAEGLLCKITLPDFTTAAESVRKLSEALRGKG